MAHISKIADWATQSDTNKKLLDNLRKIAPNATAAELAEQLGIQI